MLKPFDVEDIKNLSSHLKEIGKIAQTDKNIHVYTRQIGHHYKECFQLLDNKYKLSTAGDFKATRDEILNYCHNDASVSAILNSLANSNGRIESETGINAQDLLVRTWQLSKKASYANAKDVVIDNLRHNAKTGGGCLAGIAARLVLPYAHFVNSIIRGEKSHSRKAEKEEALQTALALSLSENASSKKEDLDLDFAIALSLSNEKPVLKKENLDLDFAIALSLSNERPVLKKENLDLDFAIALSLAESEKRKTRKAHRQ